MPFSDHGPWCEVSNACLGVGQDFIHLLKHIDWAVSGFLLLQTKLL